MPYIGRMAYLALFSWSFLAATVLPLGSGAAVIVLIRDGRSLSGVVAVATLGNPLGACTTCALGRAAARSRVPREAPLGSARSMRAMDTVARYGAPALLLSWVPLIGDCCRRGPARFCATCGPTV